MKKILILLTGIVFVITILAAGGCSPASNHDPSKGLEEVTIYLKVDEKDGEMRLKMYDSNKPDSIVVDDLYTDVKDSTKVIWALADQSGIRRIKKIGPKKPGGQIIIEDASGIFLTKKKKLKIPDNQTPGNEEAYYIKFKDTDGNTWTIDPYLRIPKKADN